MILVIENSNFQLRVKITDILASSFLDEMMETRDPRPVPAGRPNWFSVQSSLRSVASASFLC